jgi:hypothetical protein
LLQSKSAGSGRRDSSSAILRRKIVAPFFVETVALIRLLGEGKCTPVEVYGEREITLSLVYERGTLKPIADIREFERRRSQTAGVSSNRFWSIRSGTLLPISSRSRLSSQVGTVCAGLG